MITPACQAHQMLTLTHGPNGDGWRARRDPQHTLRSGRVLGLASAVFALEMRDPTLRFHS
uniref:Uncharacterized protein n=1 Tax=Physcomitrium patens TaxID=3218 RepID=A0A2K1KGW0_PHYPA|nr:hypothetical protein PHYPA_009396 [Physcomitrium patens]